MYQNALDMPHKIFWGGGHPFSRPTYACECISVTKSRDGYAYALFRCYCAVGLYRPIGHNSHSTGCRLTSL